MAGEKDPINETVEQAKDGSSAHELKVLRERIRLLAAFALLIGIAVDRVGPLFSERWIQFSDFGLALILAGILILLGERGLVAVFERWVGR